MSTKDYHYCGWMLPLMTIVIYLTCVLLVWLLQRSTLTRWAVP